MKTLKEIQDQFKDKNKAGEQVNILAYHPGQAYSIIAERLSSDQWITEVHTEDGLYLPGNGTYKFDLIKKKRHLPKDILCEVWGGGSEKRKRYSDGIGNFYVGFRSSVTNDIASMSWDNYKIIENPIQPWFGGDSSPIPEGCEFRVYFNAEWSEGKEGFMWGHQKGFSSNITAFQILGEKD